MLLLLDRSMMTVLDFHQVTIISHKYWCTLKDAILYVQVSVPSFFLLDSSLTHCPREKAAIFVDVFDNKEIK